MFTDLSLWGDAIEALPDGTFRRKGSKKQDAPNKIKPKTTRHIPGEMNKTERFYYDRRLRPALLSQEVIACGFEQLSFTLAHNTAGGKNRMTYTPDFFVVYPGHMELHEVKAKSGNWTSARDDAIAKLKMASELFPWFVWKMLLVDTKSGEIDERSF